MSTKSACSNQNQPTGECLIQSLQWRYAVKRFDSTKKISAENWKTLELALILSPSSYGLQPWRFLVVQDAAVRKALTPVSWNQTQVEDCSHFVVLAGRTSIDEKYIDRFIERTATIRKIPKESIASYAEMMKGDLVQGPRSKIISEWAARQTYIALGNLLTSASLLEIDACPMEGFIPDEYDSILKLKGFGYRSLVACALGYRHAEDKYAGQAKVRFSHEDVVQYI